MQALDLSIPVNPILARPVYLADYIEQLGTGTTDLIKRCQDLGLRRRANTITQLYPSSAKRRDQAYYLTQKGLELFASLKNDK